MSLFHRARSQGTYAAIVEIGSGSVVVAILASDPTQPMPRIIWSQRELAPLRNIDALEETIRTILTALTTAAMAFDQSGRAALRAHDPAGRIGVVKYSISAPWAYTITKRVGTTAEHPFLVSETLVEELTATARTRVQEELEHNDQLMPLALRDVAEYVLAEYANEYHITDPIGQQAESFHLAIAHVITPQRLREAITQVHDSIAAQKPQQISSSMLNFDAARITLLPNHTETCLVEVTYEATEIGIVRDGILRFCTHTPFGSYSLAREIAAITDVPLHEAFGYLHAPQPFAFLDDQTNKTKQALEALFDSYVARLHELFNQTGDELSIPRRIILHTDQTSEPFFTELIEKAVKRTIKSSPHITPITSIVQRQWQRHNTPEQTDDTALLLSAYVFHKDRAEHS